MPPKVEILSGLGRIANEATELAVAWHVLILISGVALLLGWRPSRRWTGLALTTPLVSVGTLAAVYGNPFNAVGMALLCIALLLIALRFDDRKVERASPLGALAGGSLLVFGWCYPHFLDSSRPALAYLYAAPTGLLPCPTLSIVAGYGLLCSGLRSRAWTLVLAGGALFYGLFGVLRLGVYIDIALIVGALALLSSTATGSRPPAAGH